MGFIDGPKRNGRYLRKTSNILKGVQLANFSFEEICELKIQTTDNPEASIIHVKYHSKEELDESVRPPPMLTNNLVGEGRMVLFPRDFTNDWVRERDRQKRRTVRTGEDDDELDFEEEAAHAAEAQKKAAARAIRSKAPTTEAMAEPASTHEPMQETAPPTSNHPENHDFGAEPELKSAPLAAPLPTPEQENLRQFTEQRKTIDQVSRVLQDIKQNQADEPELESEAKLENMTSSSDNFQPLNPSDSPDGTLADKEIMLAAKSLKTPLISQEELANLKEEAKQAGYAEGFKIGEEKASLQTRQVAGQLFGHVQDLLQNLMGLKDQILTNVQDNFVEVLQAMAEALLKHEFSIHPEALQTVIKKAVKEVVGQNDVKISVHPTTYEALTKLNSSDFIQSLSKDENVAIGDFRIDSTLTTVDGNATELIKTMLNKLDLSLFHSGNDDVKKAS